MHDIKLKVKCKKFSESRVARNAPSSKGQIIFACIILTPFASSMWPTQCVKIDSHENSLQSFVRAGCERAIHTFAVYEYHDSDVWLSSLDLGGDRFKRTAKVVIFG